MKVKSPTPKVLKTEKDYDLALDHVSKLMDAAPGSAAEEELELWGLLIEQYEHNAHPIDPPDPIEAIKFRMDQLGMTRKDLEAMLGGRGRVSEILSRKRRLSLEMIRRLHRNLGIPLESLIGTAA